jgi:hypothetical protein
VAVNSVYIKQDQLHGDNEFVTTDTEWSFARWGYGPDGYIAEFGADDAKDSVLVTDLQPPPPPPPTPPPQAKRGPRRQRNCGWPWSGSSQGALRAGHSTSASLVVGIWKAHILAPT